MRIALVSNTYLHDVGGVAVSDKSFAQEYSEQGIEGIFPIPAIQTFNDSGAK